MERGQNTTVIRSSAAPCAQSSRAADNLTTLNATIHQQECVDRLAGQSVLQKVDFRPRSTHTRTFRIPLVEDTSMLKHLRWE